MTKTILCYGDSNTWGLCPYEKKRYTWELRWPGQVQNILGKEVRIIENGLCGRTTCFDDPIGSDKNGKQFLPIALETSAPLDLVLIMLGTNDLKSRFNMPSTAIAQGAASLVELCQSFEPHIPNILLVAPAHIVSSTIPEDLIGWEGSIEKSKELANYYEYFSKQLSCHFFDAGKVVKASQEDGIHLDAQAHKILGEHLSVKIREILKL